MNGEVISSMLVKASFLAALTFVILLAGNSEASQQFKQMKDRLIQSVAGR